MQTFYEFITIFYKIQEISSTNRLKAKYLGASYHPRIRKRAQNLGIEEFRNWGIDIKSIEYIEFLNP
jgi:hypothetical protein